MRLDSVVKQKEVIHHRIRDFQVRDREHHDSAASRAPVDRSVRAATRVAILEVVQWINKVFIHTVLEALFYEQLFLIFH